MPFTCMPEIIAQSVLTKVSADLQIPILFLIVDEHTGEAGYQTRLKLCRFVTTQTKGVSA